MNITEVKNRAPKFNFPSSKSALKLVFEFENSILVDEHFLYNFLRSYVVLKEGIKRYLIHLSPCKCQSIFLCISMSVKNTKTSLYYI